MAAAQAGFRERLSGGQRIGYTNTRWIIFNAYIKTAKYVTENVT